MPPQNQNQVTFDPKPFDDLVRALNDTRKDLQGVASDTRNATADVKLLVAAFTQAAGVVGALDRSVVALSTHAAQVDTLTQAINQSAGKGRGKGGGGRGPDPLALAYRRRRTAQRYSRRGMDTDEVSSTLQDKRNDILAETHETTLDPRQQSINKMQDEVDIQTQFQRRQKVADSASNRLEAQRNRSLQQTAQQRYRNFTKAKATVDEFGTAGFPVASDLASNPFEQKAAEDYYKSLTPEQKSAEDLRKESETQSIQKRGLAANQRSDREQQRMDEQFERERLKVSHGKYLNYQYAQAAQSTYGVGTNPIIDAYVADPARRQESIDYYDELSPEKKIAVDLQSERQKSSISADAAKKAASAKKASDAESARQDAIYYRVYNDARHQVAVRGARNVPGVAALLNDPDVFAGANRHRATLQGPEGARADLQEQVGAAGDLRARDPFQRATSALSWMGTYNMYSMSSALDALKIPTPITFGLTAGLGAATLATKFAQGYADMANSGTELQGSMITPVSQATIQGAVQQQSALYAAGYRYGLPDNVASQLALGMGQSGVVGGPGSKAFEDAAASVKLFGLTTQDTTKLMGEIFSNLGMTQEQFTQLLQQTGSAALAMGQSPFAVGGVLAGSPNMVANLRNSSAAQTAGTASFFNKLFPVAAQATAFSNAVNTASPEGLAQLTALTGQNPNAIVGMQQTAMGQEQLSADVIRSFQQKYKSASGNAVAQAAIAQTYGSFMGLDLTDAATRNRVMNMNPDNFPGIMQAAISASAPPPSANGPAGAFFRAGDLSSVHGPLGFLGMNERALSGLAGAAWSGFAYGDTGVNQSDYGLYTSLPGPIGASWSAMQRNGGSPSAAISAFGQSLLGPGGVASALTGPANPLGYAATLLGDRASDTGVAKAIGAVNPASPGRTIIDVYIHDPNNPSSVQKVTVQGAGDNQSAGQYAANGR